MRVDADKSQRPAEADDAPVYIAHKYDALLNYGLHEAYIEKK